MRLLTANTKMCEPISVPKLSWMAAALNGGLREGSSYLLSGEPGSNKTTLAVHLAVSLATQGIPVLFVLTEQTPAELVGVVARVCGGKADAVPATVWKALDYELLDRPEGLPTLLRRKVPVRYPSVRLIIVDSLQGTGLASTATRAYQQVFDFLDEAKARGLITILVAHVTKQGKVSGPKSLEHKVDVAMTLRKAYSLRHFFITKNRYGVEVVEPIVLTTEHGRLDLSPHAVSHTASILGYAGAGDDLLEVQASISLPKLGGRAELNCPFLPAKRVKQIISTVGKVPGIDLHDLSYAINAFIPSSRAYHDEMDLPLAIALLAAYLQQPLSARSLFTGQLDLRRNIRPPDPHYLTALAQVLADQGQAQIERVYLSSAAAGLLAELQPDPGGSPIGERLDIVGVRTLDELLGLVWPSLFGRTK